MSGLYKDNELQGVHPSHLIMKSTVVANRPDVVGLAVPGTQDDEPGWQISKHSYDATSGALTQKLFAQKDGVETNGFVFSWDAMAQVQEIKLTAPLIEGNTITIDVDAVTVAQAFTTDHATTMGLWATAIAAKAGVSTAVVSTPNDLVVVVTAAAAGTAVALTNWGVTGTNINTQIRVDESKPNQSAATGLTFGPV